MPRYIDADALHKAYMELRNFKQDPQSGDWISLRAVPLTTVIRMLNEAPTIDAVEVVRGEWIDEANECDASFGIHDYICSNCNHHADDHIGGHMWYTMYKPNYCQYCGARMKGADDE